MKILVTSDTHGNLEGLDISLADIICFAGDIAPLHGRGKWHVYDQKKWMEKKFCKWAISNPEKQFIIVPGNHDFFPIAAQKFQNTVTEQINWNIDWPVNVTMLIDDMVTINGVSFYGSPWVPIISHSWAFEAENDVLEKKFSMIPENLDVLLTHSPPRIDGSFIDTSMQYGLHGPFGSKELANTIAEKQPRYTFCGHIHSGDHQPMHIGKTECRNVSRVDEDYDIAYEPFIFEIDREQL